MLIGVNGFKHAGKNTVGKYLVENYGYERMSFADLLKDSVAALFDIPREDIDELKNNPNCYVTIQLAKPLDTPTFREFLDKGQVTLKAFTFREFLKRYGTESHRDIFGVDFWVDLIAQKEGPFRDRRIVFTDCRFNNELQFVHEMHGKVVRVVRPGCEGDEHASERIPPEGSIDRVLYNNGTIAELHQNIDEMMVRWGSFYDNN